MKDETRKQLDHLHRIHNDLKELYDAKDWEGAIEYIESFRYEGATASELKTILVISKGFKDWNPEMAPVLIEIEQQLEKLTGSPVL